MPLIVRISGRTFQITELQTRVKLPIISGIIKEALFKIDLEENSDFKNVDFKDPVEIYVNGELNFAGLIREYTAKDNIGEVIAQDHSLQFDVNHVTFESIKMNPIDILGFITESEGIVSKFPDGAYNTQEREFIIIIPIINLKIKEPFRVGNTDFLVKLDHIDEDNIHKSNNIKVNPLWNNAFPKAATTVIAKTYYEAMVKGYSVISKSIDVIALKSDMSFPILTLNRGVSNNNYNYYEHFARVRIPKFVYCREKKTGFALINNMEAAIGTILDLTNVKPQDYYREFNEIFDITISKLEVTKEENAIIQSIHWLRRAIQEGENKDKLSDLWVVLELLVSGTRSERLFTEDDKSTIDQLIDNTLFNDQQKNAIKAKLDLEKLNDTPFKARFQTLLRDLNINLSHDEWRIYESARRSRNDFLHGKKNVIVSDLEVNKMKTIIEKILIAKINKLNKSANNIQTAVPNPH